MSEEEIAQLARAIAARMDPAALLEPADVAAMLEVCKRQVTDRYAKSPGFPAPVLLPTASGGRSQPRWQRADIVTGSRTESRRAGLVDRGRSSSRSPVTPLGGERSRPRQRKSIPAHGQRADNSGMRPQTTIPPVDWDKALQRSLEKYANSAAPAPSPSVPATSARCARMNEMSMARLEVRNDRVRYMERHPHIFCPLSPGEERPKDTEPPATLAPSGLSPPPPGAN